MKRAGLTRTGALWYIAAMGYDAPLAVVEYHDTLGHLMFSRLESVPSGAVPLALGIGTDIPLDVAQEIVARWNQASNQGANYALLLEFARNVAAHQGADYAQWASDLLAKLGKTP